MSSSQYVDLPQYKFNATKKRYIFIGNNFEKKCFYVGALFLCYISIYSVFGIVNALLTNSNETASGNIGGAIFVSIITLMVATFLFIFAQSKDKYICLVEKRLFFRQKTKYKSVALADIKVIIPIQKYGNGYFQGIFYAFVLKEQNFEDDKIKYDQHLTEYFSGKKDYPLFEQAFEKIKNL